MYCYLSMNDITLFCGREVEAKWEGATVSRPPSHDTGVELAGFLLPSAIDSQPDRCTRLFTYLDRASRYSSTTFLPTYTSPGAPKRHA